MAIPLHSLSGMERVFLTSAVGHPVTVYLFQKKKII